MILLNLVVLTIFCGLVDSVNKTAELWCRNNQQYECMQCSLERIEKKQCGPLTSLMRTIYLTSELPQIDYKSYINSTIKIIRTYDTITYYSCENYIEINSHNYYPTSEVLNTSHILVPKIYSIGRTIFQLCLNQYCLVRNVNTFFCENYFLKHVIFIFDESVTFTCLQNITMANIKIEDLAIAGLNNFFHYAFNIIFLVLQTKHLNHFSCHIFSDLRMLRDLYLSTTNNMESSNFSYQCLYQYCRNLIKVSLNNQVTWNECNLTNSLNNSYHNDSHNTVLAYIIVFIIPFFLLVVVVLVIAYFQYRCHRQPETQIDDFEMNYIDNNIILESSL